MIDGWRGRPIFIIGCPRSGTTLLSLMLHRHPRIAIPPENRFLLPVYFGRQDFGDLARAENRHRLAEKIVTSDWFTDLRLDPQRVTHRITQEAWTVGAAIGLVLRAYSEQLDKPRWGDKRPGYRNAIWLIRRMFPDAQFIHIVRDGRDCVSSMKSVPPWDEKGFIARVCAWTEAIDRGERARKKLGADSFFELQYEHLVADPERQLSALCEFLGERFDDAMLRPENLAGEVVPEHQTWHVWTHKEVSRRSVGAFTDRLEPWQLQLCEAIMGDRLREYGYELTGAPAPEPALLQEYRRFARNQRRRMRRRRQRDQARPYPWPVADMSADEARLRRRVAKLNRQRDALQKQADQLVRSRSWRWTAPIRAVHRRLGNAVRAR